MNNIIDIFIKPGLLLLPEKMNTNEAIAMMMAIGLQESRFKHRAQIGGPARGFFQFEKGGGFNGVLRHHATENHAQAVLSELRIKKEEAFQALEFNDALASAFARLLLYTDPNALPSMNCDPEESWEYYIRNWRPGRPIRGTWNNFWEYATKEARQCSDKKP